MGEATDVVQRFWIALQTGDATGAAALLDDDLVWANTGLPTLRGERGPQVLVALDRAGVGVEMVMHHLAAEGPVVLTDRTDTIRVGTWAASFAVQGTFEVRRGRIVRWEDHYVPGEVVLASVRGALSALGGLLPGRTGR